MLAGDAPAQCRFVAVASGAGERGLFNLTGHTASKHAVIEVVRGIAADLAGTGVTAVAVAPGGARNAGLATVSTPYVAFVDSDVEVTAVNLLKLARHFADPEVALVGPRVGVVSAQPCQVGVEIGAGVGPVERGAWTALSDGEQERVMGGTKPDGVELDARPATSHAARTDQDQYGRIIRRNTACGTSRHHGTMFVGFCASQQPLDAMLRSMAGLDGNRDALTRYATPVTGSYCFVKAFDDLVELTSSPS